MNGRIVRLLPIKGYGFIRVIGENKEYFFPKDNYEGDWEDLSKKYEKKIPLNVFFEPVNSIRGPRAEKVSLR